jgi:hypothetical protein
MASHHFLRGQNVFGLEKCHSAKIKIVFFNIQKQKNYAIYK